MIDVIRILHIIVDFDHPADQVINIPFSNGQVGYRHLIIQIIFLIEFIATDWFQVVAPVIKELILKELPGIFNRSWIAGSHALEKIN